MTHPFFTIGHSTRPIDDFLGLLRQAEVQLIVDVRTVPRSRTNPQYNGDSLPRTLCALQIDYVSLPSLGGLRGRTIEIAGSVNDFWENQSFHNYADYAMTEAFRAGLGQLRDLGHARRCAVMCAEAVRWRCHRRIIADYLIAAGETVFHIMRANLIKPALLTDAARPGPGETLIYPDHV